MHSNNYENNNMQIVNKITEIKVNSKPLQHMALNFH